jgi:hypothetical protein
MDQLENDNFFQKKVEALWQFSDRLARSTTLLRWIGYGLLVFFLLDLIEILVPPRFTDPLWELQTMGAAIEQIALPLVGLVLVFYGELNLRAKWELPFLKILSWLVLLFAIVLLLLIPLGIFNTVRIDRQSNQQISAQVDRQMTEIKQVKNQLEQATTEEKMESLLSRINDQGPSPDIQNTEQLEQVKKQFSEFMGKAETTIKSQAAATQKNQRLALLKRSVKWNLGALISGVLFFILWQGTSWARHKN